MKILLVEDDDVFAEVLVRTLKAQHYTIDVVKDGEAGWIYGSTFEYDLIVLDLGLPKLDGMSLCKRFRAEGDVTPILLLTSQDSNTAKVQGLDAGADDYVVKPFDPAELVARIRALLRRSSTNPFPLLTCGDLMLNPSTYEVSYQGHHLTLTRKEYELLELMMRDSQHVFSTEELLEHLWSSEDFPSEATVRSHIRRVRHKLVATGAPPDFIATLHGRGYYLKASGTEEFAPEQSIAAPLPRSEAHQQYLAFLNTTWTTTKPDSLDRVSVLRQAVKDLQANQLSDVQQRQAHQLAHKLVGTLSMFGLHQAMYLSRQLEQAFGNANLLQPQQAAALQNWVELLQQDIETTTQIQPDRAILSETEIPTEEGLNRLMPSPKVMIVDDDDPWLRTLPTVLKPWGFKVTTLADPQQFWAVLQAITPDVLVLDVNMPQVNGFELCQILRSDPKWYRLPVLFLSALTDSASQQQAFTVGADDYLCKPLRGSELANRILNRLQRVKAWAS